MMFRAFCAALLLQVGMLTPTKVVHLYPEGQVAGRGIVENGVEITLGPGEVTRPDTTEFYWERDGSLNAVSDSARLVLYLPEAGMVEAGQVGAGHVEAGHGQMILVCPGGGYNELMFRSEGMYAAQCLTARGYAVGIVCYRMPVGHASVPLRDVQNAFRYCRYHAAEWGISQIGIMGMSAGGHLAACASTLYVDEVTRPDFTVLFYPVTSCDAGVIHRGSFRKLTGLAPELIAAAAEVSGVVPEAAEVSSATEVSSAKIPASVAEVSAVAKPASVAAVPAAAGVSAVVPAAAEVSAADNLSSTAVAKGAANPASAAAPGAPEIADQKIADISIPESYTMEDVLAARAILEHYSPVHHVSADTPPTLLFHSIDDGVKPENSLRYFEALLAAGVKAELHIFPSGGHGWGFNTLETAGRDKLEPHRATFYSALDAFLTSLRP